MLPRNGDGGGEQGGNAVKLTDAEKAMLDGCAGRAKAKAMELLVRYGEALGAERFVETKNAGVAPKAMVFNIMTTKVALGAVVVRAPAVTDLDRDPLSVIEDGDWVKVDGDNGIVEVTKRAP